MVSFKRFLCASALFAFGSTQSSNSSSLNTTCTPAYVRSTLPLSGTNLSITIDNSSVTANAVYGVNVTNVNFYPNGGFNYCNVTFAYSHNGRNDRVQVAYWLPAPASFQNRYLATGGGGYAINSGNGSLPGGVLYGAVAGETDGGFGSFSNDLNTMNLLANGTVNWQAIYMFGYQGIHEMTVLGKQFTRNFYNMTNGTHLYSYYQGCSEGGREGWSQVQRYATQFDGVITGAPAFRFAQQQVQHLYSNVVEQTLNYYPPSCELSYIWNATIKACDPLDGKTDGVVARTDLCKLQFNMSSLIGQSYSCPATPAVVFPPSPASPAQNGTVSAQGINVTSNIIAGLRDSQGRQAYFSYQPSASFADGATQYNSTSNTWGLYISGLGGVYVERYLSLLNASTIPNLNGYTYDYLVSLMTQGWQMYQDSLQTTWPDLTPYMQAGGKVLHYHGESDDSIPTASSVRYWNQVRQIMYPGMSFNASAAALNQWYKLFLVPGAGHCAPSAAQINGPFPQTNLQVLINWVERNSTPTTLNATVLQGPNQGQNQQICGFPLRPLWTNNGTTFNCVYNQLSLNTWFYNLTAFKVPVY